jgi:hypothetical protein
MLVSRMRSSSLPQNQSRAAQGSTSGCARKYHGEFRYKGRPVGHRKLIGTTLLVKGLEFQHAIVLDAASLTRNELYVALTRGSKSLKIISSRKQLCPAG